MRGDIPDYFTLNPNELGQGAKVALAELVRKKIKSIFVPKIMSLEEAFSSDKDFILRSDSPEEFSGLSGVFTSTRFTRKDSKLVTDVYSPRDIKTIEVKSIEEAIELSRKNIEKSSSLKTYLELTGKTMKDALSHLTLQPWEHISGTNGAMFPDPTIPNKYLFVELGKGITLTRRNLNDNSVKTNGSGKNLPDDELEIVHGKLISAYESIRNLPEFNRLHGYEMEYQIDERKNIWFLQLRRGRDFRPQQFKLDRPAEANEFECSFAFGQTSPEGEVYYNQCKANDLQSKVRPKVEATMSWNPSFYPLRYPNLKVLVFPHSSLDYFVLRNFTHSTRETFAEVPVLTHLDLDKAERFRDSYFKIISDGERCLLSPHN